MELEKFGMTPAQIISSELNSLMPHCQRLAMFTYGSTVYKNKKPGDLDVYVVVDIDFCDQFVIGNYNVNVYSFDMFMDKLEKHDVVTLECIYAPLEFRLYEPAVKVLNAIKNFELNKGKLRSSFSAVASNSYVKAKKKLVVEADFDLPSSIKSLWHSIRILDFGKQLAESGKINFSSVNEVYPTIIETYQESQCEWEAIKGTVQPVYNYYSSEFKKVCPKDV